MSRRGGLCGFQGMLLSPPGVCCFRSVTAATAATSGSFAYLIPNQIERCLYGPFSKGPKRDLPPLID